MKNNFFLYLLPIFIIVLIISYGIYKNGGLSEYINYRLEKKQEKADKITDFINKKS